MPTPITESSEGGQHVEWSETFHGFIFRARIYLKRFWWILILTVTTSTLIQVWKVHDVPPTYWSGAEMSVDMVVSIAGASMTSVNESTLNYFNTQKHLLEDDSLQADAKRDALGLMPPGVSQPTISKTSIGLLQGTNIMQLMAYGSDQEYTTRYLQALMEDFRDRKHRHLESKLNDVGLDLKSVTQVYQDNIDALRKKRLDMVSQYNLVELDKKATVAADKLQTLSDHAAELSNQLNKLLTPKVNPDAGLQPPTAPVPLIAPAAVASAPAGTGTAAKENNQPAPQEVPQPGEQIALKDTTKFNNYLKLEADDNVVENIDREIAFVGLLPADPYYQGLKDKRVQRITLTQELATGGLGEQHPKLIGLKAEIASLNNDLWVLRGKRVTQLEQVKASIESELVTVLEQEKNLQAQIMEFQTNKTNLDDLDKDISRNENQYNQLATDMTTLPETKELNQDLLSINKDAMPGGVVQLDEAKKIGEVAFVGFTAGIVIIFLLGALDGRVMSVEDLTQRFEEPMLGVIPMQKRSNGQVELLKNGDQRQMFAESCRNIRSSLLYMDRKDQRPRVIMLTSSMPSEGKSTLSANLAITLGFATSSTLLVDADMRRGQLHKRFGLKNDLGLAEHIKDGATLDQVIQHTNSENLDFISCGHYPPQPGELLMSERFRESIQTMRQRYDFVIFDSPPILLTDDAASFATRADAVIFVVRAGYTRMRQVRTSMESLNRRGVNVYGMVVNFIDHREPGYYTYRYYDYYSYRPNRPSV